MSIFLRRFCLGIILTIVICLGHVKMGFSDNPGMFGQKIVSRLFIGKVLKVNNDPNICDDVTIYCSIAKAIEIIKGDSDDENFKIVIASRTFKESVSLTGTQLMGKSIILHGTGTIDNPTIIEGQGNIPAIRITFPKKVVLSNLTIKDGKAVGVDFDHYASEGDLVIKNCKIINNIGGVYIDGFKSKATIKDSVISDNKDAIQGGGIHNRGLLKIINSTITNNTVKHDGGGIYSQGDLLEIRSSTIMKNIANTSKLMGPSEPVGSGGGIYAKKTPYSTAWTPPIIANSIIYDNYIEPRNTIPNDYPKNCFGEFSSKGYNIIGDAVDNYCNVTGVGGSEASDTYQFSGDLKVSSQNANPNIIIPGPESPLVDKIPMDKCVDLNGLPLRHDLIYNARPAKGRTDAEALCDIGNIEIGCGNGLLEAGEACDDRNLLNGDGCSSKCTVELSIATLPGTTGTLAEETSPSSVDASNQLDDDTGSGRIDLEPDSTPESTVIYRRSLDTGGGACSLILN